MNAAPVLARRSFSAMLLTAVLAVLSASGLVLAVDQLFVRAGMPLEQARIAESACADHAFVSERQACARAYLGLDRVPRLASR